MKKRNNDRQIAPRKLGIEAHDLAKKVRQLDRNFRQSKDIHEDRGAIQSHLGREAKLLSQRKLRKKQPAP